MQKALISSLLTDLQSAAAGVSVEEREALSARFVELELEVCPTPLCGTPADVLFANKIFAAVEKSSFLMWDLQVGWTQVTSIRSS